MNRIKGKVEAYVVSTMEDNQRVSLLDNLAICAEKVEEEAEDLEDTGIGKYIKDCHTVVDFCDCLHVVFSHELRIFNTKQKPSFWNVAEKVSPKDAVQMIYRLPIRQSDSARCQVWIRYALKEGTIGSFMSVLSEDSRLLKEFYKPAAFVRDSEKLSSATSLIFSIMSSVQFDISLENFQGNIQVDEVDPELPQEISYRSGSRTSLDLPHNWRRKSRTRGSSANIVNIEDSQSHTELYEENDENMLQDKASEETSLCESTAISESDNGTGISESDNGTSQTDNDKTELNSQVLKIAEQISAVETSDIINDRNLQTTHEIDNVNEVMQINEEGEQSLFVESSTAENSSKDNSEACLCTSLSSYRNTDLATTPTLKISGSLNHSETSVFRKISPHSSIVSHDANMNSTESLLSSNHDTMEGNFQDYSESNYDKNKLTKIINVITTNKNNSITETSDECDGFQHMSSTDDSPLEGNCITGYIEESFLPSPKQVEGSEQLQNVLNNPGLDESSRASAKQYYVPGIHTRADVNFDTPPSMNIISKQHNEPNDSPASLSFDKTLFHKNYSSFPRNGSFTSKSAKSYDVGHFYSDSESDSWSTSDQSFSILADLGITDDFIGLKEDHFSSPETFMGFSSFEELENAIATCKDLIKQTSDKSQRRKDLVAQLVQLRLKLHELKENSKTGTPKGVKTVLGHQFYKQAKVTSTVDCDACGGTIFTMLHTIYMCSDCGFHCHRKCLNNLDKACVQNRKLTRASYNLEICPQIGLALQQFRCSDCHQKFNIQDGNIDMRLCDYSGLMFCLQCHWNEGMVIPARVIHNWDFTLHKVSRQSKHILQILNKKPEINLQDLNPALFNFVDELRDVRTLREQILSMKAYLASCRVAVEQRLLLNLQTRQHFVDNSHMYSLEDLIDIQNGVLLGELARKYNEFSKHIKDECLVCQGKGFFCEICRADDLIFPFDSHAATCTKCRSSFHRSCFTRKSCPKCERSARRTSAKLTPESENSS